MSRSSPSSGSHGYEASGSDKYSDEKCLDSGVLDSGFLSGVLDSANNLTEDEIKHDSNLRGAAANLPRVLSDLREAEFDDEYAADGKGFGDTCLDSGLILESSNDLERGCSAEEEEKSKGGEEQLLELLEEAFAPDEDGDNTLHQAIVQGFIEVVFSLVRLAPSPKYLNIRNGSSMTPLHLAVMRSQPWAIRRLVIAGCHLTARDRRGNTALHLACQLGDVSAVRCLMQPVTPHEMSVCPKPAPEHAPAPAARPRPILPQDLELRNEDGQTCLHLAATNGHFAVVQLLLIYGCDVNVVDGTCGKTALHACAESGAAEMCQFLVVQCGADVEADTWTGRTPADAAAEAGHSALADQLVRMGSDLTPPEVFDSEDDDDEDDVEEENELSEIGVGEVLAC